MSDVSSPQNANVMVLPAFGATPIQHLPLNATREGERRLEESKMVNPITYSDLEFTFNEAYRELRTNLAKITFLIAEADKAMKLAKAEVMLDKYPEFMNGRPKSQDNSDNREGFLMRDSTYLAALDRVNMLKASEALLDGKIKSFENTCRAMKKQMDLILRSGLSNANLYGK